MAVSNRTLPKPSANSKAFAEGHKRAGAALAQITELLNGWPGDGGSLKLPADCLHADSVDIATIGEIADRLEAIAADL